MNDVKDVLNKIHVEDTGQYSNHFYVIDLENSNSYAKMYTNLSKYAINTEYPNFGINTNKSTTKITNYFEIEVDNITYNLFLIADFDNDKYYLKIGEK